MKQIALILALAAAVPATASPFIDYPDDPGPPLEGTVEIVVAPEDLARCEMTLAMVTSPVQPSAPASESLVQVAEAGSDAAPDLPVARCVTEPTSGPNS